MKKGDVVSIPSGKGSGKVQARFLSEKNGVMNFKEVESGKRIRRKLADDPELKVSMEVSKDDAPVVEKEKKEKKLRPLADNVKKAVELMMENFELKNEEVIEKSGISPANLSGVRRAVKLIVNEKKSPEQANQEFKWLSISMGMNIQLMIK